ncbi:MAG: carbonate dehydratase [Gammaproteobacteria bacterium]|nr:carbonate dehydratase [Gammaproteobacteria bacterium]
MAELLTLLNSNLEWAKRIKAENPRFFNMLSEQQAPEYLWIGCSDSRVPANTIVGMLPGEIFVHRNVANMVIHTDLNCLSVIQFAVEVLQVKYIIVCGHYGCGGVAAAIKNKPLGLIDNWLRHIKDVYYHYRTAFDSCIDDEERVDMLCEFNVIQQVANVCHTTVVQDAWQRQQPLSIHGWIYSIRDGILRDLGVNYDAPEQVPEVYRNLPVAQPGK